MSESVSSGASTLVDNSNIDKDLEKNLEMGEDFKRLTLFPVNFDVLTSVHENRDQQVELRKRLSPQASAGLLKLTTILAGLSLTDAERCSVRLGLDAFVNHMTYQDWTLTSVHGDSEGADIERGPTEGPSEESEGLSEEYTSSWVGGIFLNIIWRLVFMGILACLIWQANQ